MSTFGWCQGNRDQYHHLCRHKYTSQTGVTHTCDCPNHNHEEDN